MDQVLHLFRHYVVDWHPCYWMIQKAQAYEPITNIGDGVWLVFATFGVAVWFGIARILAEIPGRRHGMMIIWWILMGLFHIWGIAFYLVFDLFVTNARSKWQDAKEEKYRDRRPEEIRGGYRSNEPPIGKNVKR